MNRFIAKHRDELNGVLSAFYRLVVPWTSAPHQPRHRDAALPERERHAVEGLRGAC